MKFIYKIILCSLILSFNSCVKDLDFDQAEDLELEPAVAASLLNFNIDQSEYDLFDVIDGTSVNQSIVDEILLPDFRTPLLEEDLERVVFQFEVNNTFEGEFTIELTFLDENDVVTYIMEPIIIPANIEGYTEEREVVILSYPAIFNSRRVTGTLNFNGIISTVNEGNLVFKSAGIFYFSIN